MKILGSIVYVISHLIIFGGKEIAQEGGEILPNVLAKFCENYVTSKFHQPVSWTLCTQQF